jgi:hypothetical protein
LYSQLGNQTKVAQFANVAIKYGYKTNSKDEVALASAYRFDAEYANGNFPVAVRDAKVSFVQSPDLIYDQFDSVPQKESFRTSASDKLTAGQWQVLMAAQRAGLQTKLLSSAAGRIEPTEILPDWSGKRASIELPKAGTYVANVSKKPDTEKSDVK